MIVYPKCWREVGEPIASKKIITVVKDVLTEINCRNLALSGGVDSSTMLALMVDVFKKEDICCFNIALSEKHPDFIYSDLVAKLFKVKIIHHIPTKHLEKNVGEFDGDEIVREFFCWLQGCGCESIVTCDGIDEFMGGYYDHMKFPTEEMYYSYMRRFQNEQAKPLDKNSGETKVFLPYIDDRVICLLSQIPYSERFDMNERKKVVNKIARIKKIPEEIIVRHKYGFIDVMKIKKGERQ